MAIKIVFRKYLIILSFACQSAELKMEEIKSSVKPIYDETVSTKKKYYRKHAACGVCNKWMRSDHLKRHLNTHADLTIIEDAVAIRNELDFEHVLLCYNDIYLEKYIRGKQIYDILSKGEIVEDSLPIHHKQALNVYRKSRTPMEFMLIVLRP